MSTLEECDPTVQSPATHAEWTGMLDDFRALGGLAENVILRRGSAGPGLFPEDAGKPFLLQVPENLLVRARDVEFVDDALGIRNDADLASAERNFFEHYQTTFSWGGGGRAEAARIISMFDTLPVELRAILGTDFAMQDVLEGEPGERIRKQFLRRRTINRRRDTYFVPLIELANCGADGVSCLSDQQGGMLIEGETGHEILLDLGPHDALGTFRKLGIAVERPHAYSLPMTTKINGMDLTIARNVAAKTERAGFFIPELRTESGKLALSYLMVGNANFPRASRGIFDALMREAGIPGAAEAFDLILHFNRAKFLNLLEALEPLQGEMVVRLRSMAHFELEALAQCVGTREL